MRSRTGSAAAEDRRRHIVWVSGTGVFALLLIGMLAVGGLARINNVVSSQRNDFEAGRRASCLQQNDGTMRERQAFRDSVQSIRPAGPSDPRFDAFFAAYIANVDKNLRYRDCSPAGIAAYFNHPPAEIDCDPDPAYPGFCK